MSTAASAPFSRNFLTSLFNWILPAQNRRKFKRVRVPFLLRYVVEASGTGAVTNLKDLSAGGVLFASNQPLLQGGNLKLEINLPTVEKPISASARVVRVSKGAQSGIYRIATKFIDLNPQDKKLIRQLIERMARHRKDKNLVNRKKRIWSLS